jgi:hypothetical protein
VPAFPTTFELNWPVIRNHRVWFGGARLENIWLDPTKAPVGRS